MCFNVRVQESCVLQCSRLQYNNYRSMIIQHVILEGSEEDVEVRKAFSNFLEDFISRNKLIIDMSQILVNNLL